jgi:quercetin dioxygenase-like cupin family protein
MQQWNLTTPNEGDRTGPRVLFSTPEARGVLIDLASGEELGDHRVHERAIVQVLEGSVACTSEAVETTCVAGTMVVFEPSETHSLHALESSRLLLVLAPWPGNEHYRGDEGKDPHELPVHATQQPEDDRG